MNESAKIAIVLTVGWICLMLLGFLFAELSYRAGFRAGEKSKRKGTAMNQTRYTVEVVRSGQPRAYADTEHEYIVHIEQNKSCWAKPGTPEDWRPWLYPEGNDDPGKKWFQNWCDKIVKTLCQNFYRKVGEDGSDWASPILKWMRFDHAKGTIHVFITESYTD